MMNLWLMISHDQYELPLAVADTAEQLGEMVGVSKSTINANIHNARKNGWWCRYVKVRIEEDTDEEDIHQ